MDLKKGEIMKLILVKIIREVTEKVIEGSNLNHGEDKVSNTKEIIDFFRNKRGNMDH
jgi:hypothetical protein